MPRQGPAPIRGRPEARAPHLFCFGLGFSALALARRLLAEGFAVSGTCRTAEKAATLAALGIGTFVFDRGRPLEDPAAVLAPVTDIVSSVPPDAEGDPVMDHHRAHILAADGLRWIGYLSTTGVYGDTGGAQVDETAPLVPTSERSRRRVDAEAAWLALHWEHDKPVHIFRLAGIYGPGRSAIDQVRGGRDLRVRKPGHLFSRIHVDDIATVLRASMARPDPGRIYNVCDDAPAEPADVLAFACRLLGREPPPAVPLEEAAPRMSPMALSFWRDNRRVSNARMKLELGIKLAHPDYVSGLRAILEAERAGQP